MDEDKKPNHTEEELDELLKTIEEIKKKQEENNKNNKKKKRGFFAIEFGGVFHRNYILNFLFSVLLNFTLTYLIIESLDLAEYESLIYLFLFVLLFTVVEAFYRTYIMVKHFSLIIKSFGTIFYFGYVLIVYVLDIYVLAGNFEFKAGVLLMVYITLFTIIRYFVAVFMKRKIRGY